MSFLNKIFKSSAQKYPQNFYPYYMDMILGCNAAIGKTETNTMADSYGDRLSYTVNNCIDGKTFELKAARIFNGQEYKTEVIAERTSNGEGYIIRG